VIGHAPARHTPQLAVVVTGEEVTQAAALDPLLAHRHVRGVLLAEQGAGAMQPTAHLFGRYAHRRADLGIAETLQFPPQEETARAGGHARCRLPHLLAQVGPLYPGSGVRLDLVAYNVFLLHPYSSHAAY